ncbi:hypothetical protein LJC48_01280 [Desulfovibrio sp. OttesenSCG-928-C06]|nr:hypothetical protein [Desulfovibrio sp. OttesenSCG-928-C06]
MKKALLLPLVLLMLYGCSSSHMADVAPAEMSEAVAVEESAIVFLRATNMGGAVQAPVIEVSEEGPEFVAIVSAAKKVMHRTAAGKHVYVIGGESSGALKADLAPGKIYYVYVEPKLGLWKARFVMVPVKPGELAKDSFKKDLGWCKWSKPGPTAEAWFRQNMSSMSEKAQEALKENNIPQILPEDGVDSPVEPIK